MTDQKIDFQRYKPRLIEYLSTVCGTQAQNGVNFRCPLHDDGDTPDKWSAIVRNNQSMTCYGCGFHGDIYDLCGALTGETNIAEQYRSVARSFGDIAENGTYKPYTPPKHIPKTEPIFTPDLEALRKVDAWLIGQKDFYIEQTASFFHTRGVPADLVGSCVSQVFYWPGYGLALRELGKDTLDKAGIPERAFIPAGIIVRLAVGYKLHYFDDMGATIKRGSIASKTFPFPDLPIDSDTVILCEGELDQITARAAGFDNVRSIGGVNGLRPKDAEKLRGYNVVLAMDNDDAGRRAIQKIGNMIAEIPGISAVRYTKYPADTKEKDLDDLVKAGKSDFLAEIIKGAIYAEGQKGGTRHGGSGGLACGSGQIGMASARTDDGNGENDTGALRSVQPAVPVRAGGIEDTGNTGHTGTEKGGIDYAGEEDGRGYNQGRDVVAESGKNIVEGNATEPDRTPDNGNGERLEGADSGDKTGDIIPPDQIPFRFLGFDAGAYYVMPKNQNIPLSISRGEKSIGDKLFEIGVRDWWEACFTKTVYTKTGEPIEVFDKESAVEWFRAESVKHGMYDDEKILGLGAHVDGKQIVVNTGRAVVSPDGTVSRYELYNGKNVYCRSKSEIVISAEPWTEEDGQFFVDQIRTFNFNTESAYLAIPGFCALAPFASCLFRRPHIFITGARGLGKTYLLHDIIIPIIGNQTIYADAGKGGITEAGLRQTAGADCRPMVIDEFEANKKSDLAMVDNILALARTAYGGEKTIKGSSSQKAISFATKMMFCFAAVNVNISDAATRSRFAICRIGGKSHGKAKRIKNPDGLRARMFRRLQTIRDEIDTCHDMLMETEENGGLDFEFREADTFSPLFAGYWAIVSDAPFGDTTRPQDAELLEQIKNAARSIRVNEESEIDEERVLTRIFQEKVRISSDKEKTIAQMLTELDELKKMLYPEQVQLYGLRRMKGTESMGCSGVEVLAVSTKNDMIAKMLENTPFSNYKEVLKRNSAAMFGGCAKTVRIAGVTQSAIIFDWKLIEELYFSDYADKVPF
jgi:5S rRNA maturation endonuclease (ribonuclease M5)